MGDGGSRWAELTHEERAGAEAAGSGGREEGAPDSAGERGKGGLGAGGRGRGRATRCSVSPAHPQLALGSGTGGWSCTRSHGWPKVEPSWPSAWHLPPPAYTHIQLSFLFSTPHFSPHTISLCLEVGSSHTPRAGFLAQAGQSGVKVFDTGPQSCHLLVREGPLCGHFSASIYTGCQ